MKTTLSVTVVASVLVILEVLLRLRVVVLSGKL